MEIAELLAKVLATENISVTKQKVHTASFDIVNRNLTLPMWEGLEPVVETMLVCHEVGHALFTPTAYVDTVRDNRKIADVLNVLEDARIERLFKERYPGSRKDFAGAYKNMRDTDFFELGDRNVNHMGFVDRINVYFKLGIMSGVKFSAEEYSYVKRATETVTFEEVKALAEDILAYVKDKAEERRMKNLESLEADPNGDIEADGEPGESTLMEGDEGDEFGDEEYDAEGGNEEQENLKYEPGNDDGVGASNSTFDPDYNSETMKTLERKLESVSGVGESPIYNEFDEHYNDDVLISYKKMLETCRVRNATMMVDIKYQADRFKRETGTQVNHLVSQFELKKAAQMYALRTVHKTGRLNTDIIAQYKVKDDLFLRSARVPEGKNHGMIMLLDWSGSMTSGNKIYHSIDQAVQLAMFCRMVGIPYRVCAFSSSRGDRTYTRQNHLADHLSLIELMSSEMTTMEHNEAIGYMESRLIVRSYGLSSTPFSPALLYMRKYIPEFKERYKIDKLNLITFTDGENTSIVCNDVRRNQGMYIKDSVTKKSYLVAQGEMFPNSRINNINEVTALYRMLKDRFNCTITSYFITNNLKEGVVNSGFYKERDTVSANDFKAKGFITMKGYGRDMALVVNPNMLRTHEFVVGNISSDMTPAKIASELRKGAKSSIKGKILIEKFMDVIS